MMLGLVLLSFHNPSLIPTHEHMNTWLQLPSAHSWLRFTALANTLFLFLFFLSLFLFFFLLSLFLFLWLQTGIYHYLFKICTWMFHRNLNFNKSFSYLVIHPDSQAQSPEINLDSFCFLTAHFQLIIKSCWFYFLSDLFISDLPHCGHPSLSYCNSLLIGMIASILAFFRSILYLYLKWFFKKVNLMFFSNVKTFKPSLLG